MKLTRRILGGYAIILFIGVIMYCFIPSESFVLKKVQDADKAKRVQEHHNIHDALMKGDFQQVEELWVNDRQTFHYNGDQLRISALGEAENYIGWIVIERKTVNDDKIEVNQYKPLAFFNGNEFTEKIPPAELLLDGDQLILIEPEKLRFEMIEFKNEFTINQFRGEKGLSILEGNLNHVISQKTIHLKIPQKLEIIDESNSNIVELEG